MSGFLLAASLFGGRPLLAQDASLGGFIPYVGIGYTAEFKTLDALDIGSIPFIADPAFSLGAPLLGTGGTPYFDVALLDTGAATHILTQEAFAGFDIAGAGLRGTNQQIVGGATGTIITEINDAAGIYATGFGNRTATGASLAFDQSTLRGQTSIATLTAPEEWDLPNILGLPFAAQHGIAILNSQPQVFQHQGRTIRTPEVEFFDLGTGADYGVTRRAPLTLNPGIGFIQGPQFVFNFDLGDALSGGDLAVHDNPASPSVVQDSNGAGGGLFLEVDFKNDGNEFQDKPLLFDTGADLTVLSQITAKRLGFDAVLDTPDFVLEVEGSGGVQGGVPGFFIEELNIDTIGGSFTLQNVPVAVLDVTNPNDPGNILDGIIGTHLFNGRDIVIDAQASFGQGGNGPSLYISDPVTNQRTWNGSSGDEWTAADSWAEGDAPNELSEVVVGPATGSSDVTASVVDDQSAFRLTVAGADGEPARLAIADSASLTVFGETRIETGGEISLEGGRLDAQFINIEAGQLTGNGEVFVGTGIIFSSVRNLGGAVAPEPTATESELIGTLSIDGDYSSQAESTLAINLEQLGDIKLSDLVETTRFAFLDGLLDVDAGQRSDLDLQVGDEFTILTAEEEIFGEFSRLQLPIGFLWDVVYDSNEVRLVVTGVGLEGDFNADGVVDLADYTVFRDGLGIEYSTIDFLKFRENFGISLTPAITVVPEPTSTLLLAVMLPLLASRPARKKARSVKAR